MLANAIVELFQDGGPIMWPILVVALVMVAVIAERTVFWFVLGRRRNPAALEKVLAAMDNHDFKAAVAVAMMGGKRKNNF